MTLRMWLLCLLCAAVPAWGSDEKGGAAPEPETKEGVLEDLEWHPNDDAKTWKEACAFAPGGELWRLSGSSGGNAVSTGEELFALRHQGQTVMKFGQQGPPELGGDAEIEESDRWKVRCQPGRIDIVTPAVTVSLQVEATEFKLDPRFSRILRPGSRELGAPAVQSLNEVLTALLSSMGMDALNGTGVVEALIRARLLTVERLLAASNLDMAGNWLSTLPSGPDLPELSSWAADLKRRVEDLRSKSPLMATGARRVGTLLSLPRALDDEDEPLVFWRGTQLCVRQEASQPPSMRCVEAKTGSWGKVEPYRSPYGQDSHVELEYLGRAGAYQTRVSSSDAEDTTGDEDTWSDPVVVARAKGRLVVVDSKDPRQHQGKENFERTSGLVSLLAGGGRYYFSEPDKLRSRRVEGLSWKFVVPVSGSEVRCAVPPRVSADGRWAACPAGPAGAEGTPEAKAPSSFDLLLFGLTPRAP